MKKAWVYGLAAMLGLGVSAVIANQASASAATVPIVIQSATSKCDTGSAPDHGASQSAIVPPLADNKVEVPIVTVSSDDDQKAGNTSSADSSSVSSSQQNGAATSDTGAETVGSQAPVTNGNVTSSATAQQDDRDAHPSVSEPMIKTAQEVNATEASSSKAPTSKERDEQAIVAAAQAATHDNVKSGHTISVVPESVTSFIGSTHKQPQNAFEIIWQALIETVQMRQQCPTNFDFVQSTFIATKRELSKAFSSPVFGKSLQLDSVSPFNQVFGKMINLIDQVLLTHLVFPD
ncbi:FliK family flagellar hook-length control protein [Lacticaseibacillus paracasei]|uniref:FliK family flagellar hook-length control protein n=1 Tax=Lacticaseibacillus paracasei TaxID=1597 RepID=UPI00192C4EF6|nr:FliK family flagellar hook-length control protein [Lacticaseibacillus paracasei]CAD7484421.1 conserved exported hypothetical protein [Lacticaseibacillus paracasei]